MNIEITENIIRGSIVYALSQKFGSNYKYYDEEIIEGFEKPSFHVYRINTFNRKGYTGNNYKMEDNNYRYVVKYFPAVNDGIMGDINNKIDILKETFKYLKIINMGIETIEGVETNVIYSKENRINDINFTTSQDILLCEIQFPVRTIEYLETEKVEDNILEQGIKENI